MTPEKKQELLDILTKDTDKTKALKKVTKQDLYDLMTSLSEDSLNKIVQLQDELSKATKSENNSSELEELKQKTEELLKTISEKDVQIQQKDFKITNNSTIINSLLDKIDSIQSKNNWLLLSCGILLIILSIILLF